MPTMGRIQPVVRGSSKRGFIGIAAVHRIHDQLSVRVPFGDAEQPVGDEPPAGVAGHSTFPGSAACNVVRIEESRSRCPRRSPGGMIGARMR